jgi:hypothetical protein
MQLSEIISKYIQLRDKKAQMKAEYEGAVAPIQAALDKAEAAMLTVMQQQGVESFRTDAGTVYQSTRTSASVADWDSAFGFIQANNLWNMLEKRVSKSAVDEYVAQNNDLPPGINYRSEITVGVRRA